MVTFHGNNPAIRVMSVFRGKVGRRHCPNVFSRPSHSDLDLRSLKLRNGTLGLAVLP
jgi:hypothetical protein